MGYKLFTIALLATVFVDAKKGIDQRGSMKVREEKKRDKDAEMDQQFLQWAADNNKNYETRKMMMKHKKKFIQSCEDVEKLNDAPKKAGRNVKFAVNFLADVEDEDYMKLLGNIQDSSSDDVRMLSKDLDSSVRSLNETGLLSANETSEINWADEGCMIDVKDQANCGSCVPFAAASVMEALICIRDTKANADNLVDPIRLSEQHMLECSMRGAAVVETDYGNLGCDGAYPYKQAEFIVAEGVVAYDNYRSYSESDSVACEHDAADVVAKAASYGRLTASTPLSDVLAQLQKGPMMVGVSAGNTAWRNYSSGIMSTGSAACPYGAQLDHAVILVGYGIDIVTREIGGESSTTCRSATRGEKRARSCNDGGVMDRRNKKCCTTVTIDPETIEEEVGYFIVQNQWGTGWGDNGFIKLEAMDGYGVCGVNRDIFFFEL